ncbi:MAG: hypothetical protein MJA27_11815 [Pseudanabaenales cyanobacterium]|nr:hypothetical protein [Pseudanabaenales cyanobacterium]
MSSQPLIQRKRDLIERYSSCPLGITPQQFYAKWQMNQAEIAGRIELTPSSFFRILDSPLSIP